MPPEGVREMTEYILAHRGSDAPFDIVHIGKTIGSSHVDAATVQEYADVGVTWWLENVSPWAFDWVEGAPWPMDKMHQRILDGPPVL